MGYSTNFEGQFDLDKPLKPEHKAYLIRFNETRRMKRNAEIAEQLPDSIRISAGLPIGREGAFFVGSTKPAGQDYDSPSIIDNNTPPDQQPGLWCQWTPNKNGTAIEWDMGEKFYNYVEWINYLINTFLISWGYTLNGKVYWYGEDSDDRGCIHVKNNRVQAIPTEFINREPVWY